MTTVAAPSSWETLNDIFLEQVAKLAELDTADARLREKIAARRAARKERQKRTSSARQWPFCCQP
jgi:hypothetical protein